MGDAYVLVMDVPTGVHRILENGDVLLDADGNPAIALTHVLATGDDAEGQDITNVGQLTFNAGNTVYLSESSDKLAVTAPSGLDAPVINVPTTCAIQVAASSKLTIAADAVTAAVPVLLPSGSAAAPGLAFTGDTNTGLYRSGAETMVFVTNGAARITIGTVAIVPSIPIYMPDGAAATPSLTFGSDTDTGIFRSANNTLGFTAGGTIKGAVGANGFLASSGVAATPSYAFISDTGSGMYSGGASTIGIATGGVLRFSLTATLITSTLPFKAPDGNSGNPSYGFSGDSGLGMARAGSNTMIFLSGAATRMSISSTAVNLTVPITQTGTMVLDATAAVQLKANGTQVLACNTSLVAVTTVPLRVQAGAVGTPSFYFDGSATTGLYRPAADTIGVAVAGVLTAQFNAAGLEVVAGSLTTPAAAVSGPTVNVTDAQSTLLVNAGTGVTTVNLPAASGRSGRIYAIKKTDASANAVTIDPNGAELINGAATFSLPAQHDAVIIQCDGTGWHVLSGYSV